MRLGSERLLKWAWGVQWEKEATFKLKYAVPINRTKERKPKDSVSGVTSESVSG